MPILNAPTECGSSCPAPLMPLRWFLPGRFGGAAPRRALVTATLMLALTTTPIAGLVPAVGAFQSQADPASVEVVQPPAGDDAGAASMARATEVLLRQGEQGVVALNQLAQVEVINPLPAPEMADISAIEQPAEPATSPIEPVPAVTIPPFDAMGEVRATATTFGERATAALRSTSRSETSTVARSVWSAGATLSRVRAATVTTSWQAASLAVQQTARARQVADNQSPQANPASAAMRFVAPLQNGLPLATLQTVLVPMLAGAGVLGLLLWRRKSEPFVLKARPAQA